MSPAACWCRTPTFARCRDSDLKVVTKRPPTPEEKRALLFAWKVCKHVKSNAIVYARDGQTVGVGAGQMSRVDSAKIGAMKAQLPLKGTVAASDAFFPFPDGVEEIAKAGATAIIQPGGSQRDPEVIEAADRLGLAMLFHRSPSLPPLRNRASGFGSLTIEAASSGSPAVIVTCKSVKYCQPALQNLTPKPGAGSPKPEARTRSHSFPPQVPVLLVSRYFSRPFLSSG